MAKIELDEIAGPNGGEESRRLALHWTDQLKTVTDQAEYKRWLKRGQDIEKRYRDERNRTDEEGQRRYNALWSNVEILKPALYGKCPQPVAERRFKDKDPTGRSAAQMLERALRNEIEICGFNEALQQAVSDYLLPGRGTVWVRYEPEIEESVSLPPVTETDLRDSEGNILVGKDAAGYGQQSDTSADRGTQNPGDIREGSTDEGEDEGEPEEPTEEPEDKEELEEEKLFDTGDRIIRESTPVDYVNWRDFITLPVKARVWKEVTAVGKRVYLSRNQMIKRFGKEIGKGIPIERDTRGQATQFTTMQSIGDEDKAQIWEIWDRDTETVYWVAENYPYLCDKKEDPLNLENFFPCPPPIYANSTTSSLTPVPDFIQYQDQATQIDELTQRIALVTKALKVAGVYNAAAHGIQRLFNESVENELIPVDDWAAFSEKGGIQGNLSFIPINDIMLILNELMKAKDMQVQEMDRLTGITDIMRGTTDARETLGGQRLKSNSAGTRLTSRQNEIARFARDTVRIMADIMCQHFSPPSLIEISGALYEEGLGPDDMPPLNDLLNKGAPTPGSQPTPGLPGQPQAPTSGALPAPGQPGAGPGAPPPAPGMPPPAGPPLGIPGAPPQGEHQRFAEQWVQRQQMMEQQIPWQLVHKLQALQRIKKAIDLLRDERVRGFRVDIEVDSTIFPDAEQEKQDRTQFIAGITQFLQVATVLGSQMPIAIPMLGKLLQFGVRGYRVGRDLETTIEEFSDAAIIQAQLAQKQAQNQPNPEQQKIEIEKVKALSQVQTDQAKIKNDAARAQADVQTEQIRAQSQRDTGMLDIQRQREQSQAEVQDRHMEMAAKTHETQSKIQQTQMATEAEKQSHEMEMRMKQTEVMIELLKYQLEQYKAQMAAQHASMMPAMPTGPTEGPGNA